MLTLLLIILLQIILPRTARRTDPRARRAVLHDELGGHRDVVGLRVRDNNNNNNTITITTTTNNNNNDTNTTNNNNNNNSNTTYNNKKKKNQNNEPRRCMPSRPRAQLVGHRLSWVLAPAFRKYMYIYIYIYMYTYYIYIYIYCAQEIGTSEIIVDFSGMFRCTFLRVTSGV